MTEFEQGVLAGIVLTSLIMLIWKLERARLMRR